MHRLLQLRRYNLLGQWDIYALQTVGVPRPSKSVLWNKDAIITADYSHQPVFLEEDVVFSITANSTVR